ncbi:acylphosphatase [Faunimonas pinastri]|uniref:Acylphosphatase n=1 Tax=Faunimonas pinastri TaxID=1855383 RepID=A0A1H9KLD9_9HYPH|nr:acylphosphatase [Faunimonas pinastri]SEQ99918.1 acylphosphatase [Faunimonas pinastri]
MSSADHGSVRVRISGRVQGVGFRAWTEREAQLRNLSGWVMNTPGGDVEALFAGPADRVEDMLAACGKGPRLASVKTVEVIGTGEESPEPFTIRAK